MINFKLNLDVRLKRSLGMQNLKVLQIEYDYIGSNVIYIDDDGLKLLNYYRLILKLARSNLNCKIISFKSYPVIK